MEQFLANRLIIVTLAAVLALLLIAWIAARVQTARRSRALVAALDDSTRGRVTLQRGPGAAGLAGVIEPAPDPYVSLTVNPAPRLPGRPRPIGHATARATSQR